MFKRVRSADEADPQDEFDVSVEQIDATPDVYDVVDDIAVSTFRPATYADVEPAPPVPAPPTGLEVPAKNASTEAWREYALAAAEFAGVTIEIPDDASRTAIIGTLEQIGLPTE